MHIDPIAFAVGSLSIRWYALCALAGAAAAYLAFRRFASGALPPRTIDDLFIWMSLGALTGARAGFVLLYAPEYFFADPLRIVSPFGAGGEWIGLRGLSFHGGLAGAALVLWVFAARRDLRGAPFWRSVDALALSVPFISFFGRIGNFLNSELPGRTMEGWWGVRTSFEESFLRHPSQLYAALLEGAFLFLVLIFLRKRSKLPGTLAAAYLFLYGAARFAGEYFREPDPWLGTFPGGFSLGQLLSFTCMAAGIALGAWIFRKNRAIIGND